MLPLSFYLAMMDDEEHKLKFSFLYNTYKNKMRYIALSYSKDDEFVKDVLQESFTNIIKNIDKIRTDNPSETYSYIATITRNAAIDTVKKNNKFIIINDYENIEEFFIDKTNYENKAINILLHYDIMTIFEEMDEMYSIPLSLWRDGYTYAEISAFLNISISTVRGRIERGLKYIRKKLGVKK